MKKTISIVLLSTVSAQDSIKAKFDVHFNEIFGELTPGGFFDTINTFFLDTLAKDQSLELTNMKDFNLEKANLKCDDFDSWKDDANKTLNFFNKETMNKEWFIEICKNIA